MNILPYYYNIHIKIKSIYSNKAPFKLKFLTNSLGSAGETESVFTDVSEQKHKDGYTCTHCQSTNVIRFGKYQVKTTINTIERQRYRCKECGKTFTDMTNTPLQRTHMPSKWLQFIECMIEGYSSEIS